MGCGFFGPFKYIRHLLIAFLILSHTILKVDRQGIENLKLVTAFALVSKYLFVGLKCCYIYV